ncbi:MAG: glycosyltransferase, partial [Nanoarchaeota archaeon]
DIDISFLGVKSINNRQEILDRLTPELKKRNISFYWGGGRREENLSIENYANIMQRSKISLNFSGLGNFIQRKGKVLEAIFCGSFVLTDSDAWDELDLIVFKNEQHLLELINHYLFIDPLNREFLAAAALEQVLNKFTSQLFWQSILERVEQIKKCD